MHDEPQDTRSIGIFTTDTKLIIKVWDDAMRVVTGIEAGDAVGKELTRLAPDLSERGLLPRFERVRELGTSEVLSPAFHKYLFRCPPRIPSKHFTEMRQLVKISALRKDEEIYGLMVVVEDVTPRLEQEREFALMLRDPDEAVRLKAAKGVSQGDEPLSPESSMAMIGALGDSSWRVRRRLVDGLSRRLAPDAVTALLEAVRKDHLDFGLLNSALQVLQATSVDTTQTLTDFLRGPDADLRIQAALALGEQKNQAAIPGLLTALDDPDPNVRYHAIEALGKLKAADAVESLLSIAESRDFFLAFPALEALGKIGGAGIAARVLQLVNDEDIREAAVEALGAVGDISAAGPIVGLLNDRFITPNVASNALAALHQSPMAGTAGELVPEIVKRDLASHAIADIASAFGSGSDNDLRGLTAVAAWLDDDAIREALADLMERPEYCEQAAHTLAAHGEPAVDILVQKLGSGDAEVRTAAVHALGSLDTAGSTEALVTTLAAAGETSAAAAQALSSSSDPRAFDALVDALATDNSMLRRVAANALGSMAGSEMSARLCSLMNNPDPRVREAGVRVVSEMDSTDCGSAVLAACSDTDGAVRAAAVEQLAKFPADEVIARLEHALRDEVPQVRAAAVRVLGRIEGELPIKALRAALSDPDPWTRYFAVRSLAEKKDAESYEFLRKLSENDTAEQVRVAAAEAVAER